MIVCTFWRFYVQRYVTTETRSTAITAHLETLGVSTKKIKKTFDKQVAEGRGAKSETLPSRPSLNGDACYQVLHDFDWFLEFTHETEQCGGDRKAVEAVIEAYKELLATIAPHASGEAEAEADEEAEAQSSKAEAYRKAVWDEFWSTQGKRDAQAAKAKAAARTFLAKLSSTIPAGAMDSVYVHFLAVHIGDQVAAYGPLWYWSGEGLEHKNFAWKKAGRACAQRGLAPHQNGGQKPRDGGPQKRAINAKGREGQTAMAVILQEEHGGVARRGRAKRARHCLPVSV